MATTEQQFVPLAATHPTELVRDEMRARGMKSKELAARLGMKAPNLSRFLNNKEDITPAMAVRLERALGIPADYWMRLQVGYYQDLETIRRRDAQEAQSAQVEAALRAALNLPLLLKALALDGYRFAKDRLAALYGMFKVSDVDGLLVLSSAEGRFKKSDVLDTESRNLATWILLARHACDGAVDSLPPYTGGVDAAAEAIAAEANAQTLTEAGIRSLLAERGIGYCVVKKIEKTPVDAFSTIVGGHPFIVVSHRRNNMDMLAFDVLHECGHIALHMAGGASFVSYNQDAGDARGSEHEANAYAMDKLIPPQLWRELMSKSCRSLNVYDVFKAVTSGAKEQGISPSIAAWRFKYETGNYRIPGYRSRQVY